MGKAYRVATYRPVDNRKALAAYAKLAGSAIMASGGRIPARGSRVSCMRQDSSSARH
jgi:uncharacterized protein (DUF1330 family)